MAHKIQRAESLCRVSRRGPDDDQRKNRKRILLFFNRGHALGFEDGKKPVAGLPPGDVFLELNSLKGIMPIEFTNFVQKPITQRECCV